jgi:hypothetical protein
MQGGMATNLRAAHIYRVEELLLAKPIACLECLMPAVEGK